MLKKFLSTLVILGAVAGVPAVATADSAKAQKSEDGFVSLFNGENLDGWKGATNGYVVENGYIKSLPESGGHLFVADREFADFVIRMEFRLTPGANNGLGVRVPLDGKKASSEGLEIQILDDRDPQYKDIKDWQAHGSLYFFAAAKRDVLRPVGEWNEQEVVLNGRELKITLNGEKILDINLDEVAAKPASGERHPGIDRTSGLLGFLGHNTEVHFRNIRIKELNTEK